MKSTTTEASKQGDDDSYELKLKENDIQLSNPLINCRKPRENCLRKIGRYVFQTIDDRDRTVDNRGGVFPSNYISNKIDNRKYNIVTFLPLFLYNQYKVFSNLYFLIIALLQLYEPFRVGFMIAYFGPLVIVLGLSLLKEIWDEFKIYFKDQEVNREKFIKVVNGKERAITSAQIRVGDILKLKKNERVPADMLLLHTSEENGTIFVRTDQLDGETDWKVREAVKATQHVSTLNIAGFNWAAIIEPPSDQIYDFKGGFYGDGGAYEPLRLAQTLWANMRIASGEVMGLVIYTGKETRMARNTKRTNQKRGKTDDEVNLIMKVMFVILACLTVMLFFLSFKSFNRHFYVQIIRTFLLLSSIIPISLKVNLDFAKLYYAYHISNDKQLPGAIARNSAIPEELGRVQYLLSDKTGTLTKNEMIFRNLRTTFGEFNDDNFNELRQRAQRVFGVFRASVLEEPNQNRRATALDDASNQVLLRLVFLSIMLCNNVSPNEEGETRTLQASSPDEVSLVLFGESLGFKLQARAPDSITLQLPGGTLEKWIILYNFPFTSERKRMGIVIQNSETKQVLFLLKGADSVMAEKVSVQEKVFVEEEAEKLSKEGFRTLVFEYKMLSDAAYASFSTKMLNASRDLRMRDREEAKVVAELEKDMRVLAVTGVEDLLQEDIKSSIITLKKAGIKVWMLTGDKLETAKNIAVTTGFRSIEQKFYEITSDKKSELERLLLEFNEKDLLIVSGQSLDIVLQCSHLKRLFFERVRDCASVVLCRCMPKQKAEVTLAIRKYFGQVVCAIGDGGNDVGMIQSANVGIGIEGHEGMQAALASDFSVIKFNQIQRLLLWHGRLSYIRSSLLNNFIIHRGLVITIIQVLFMITFYHVTIFIFSGYTTLCYPTLFTGFSVFALILDEDIPVHQAFNYPELYLLVQNGQNISVAEFLSWTWKSIFQGAVIILLALIYLRNDFAEFTTIMFTALIFLEYLNIFSAIRTWHRYILLSVFFSALIYIFCLLFLKGLFEFSELSSLIVFKTFLITVAAWLPFQLFNSIQRRCFPSQIDKVIEEARVFERRLYYQNNKQNF